MASANHICFHSFSYCYLTLVHSFTNHSNSNSTKKQTQTFFHSCSPFHLFIRTNEWEMFFLAMLLRGVNLNTDHHHHLVKINGSSNWWHAHSQISQLLMCGSLTEIWLNWRWKTWSSKMKHWTPFCCWCRQAIQTHKPKMKKVIDEIEGLLVVIQMINLIFPLVHSLTRTHSDLLFGVFK